jgi:hypothetical protein
LLESVLRGDLHSALGLRNGLCGSETLIERSAMRSFRGTRSTRIETHRTNSTRRSGVVANRANRGFVIPLAESDDQGEPASKAHDGGRQEAVVFAQICTARAVIGRQTAPALLGITSQE